MWKIAFSLAILVVSGLMMYSSYLITSGINQISLEVFLVLIPVMGILAFVLAVLVIAFLVMLEVSHKRKV